MKQYYFVSKEGRVLIIIATIIINVVFVVGIYCSFRDKAYLISIFLFLTYIFMTYYMMNNLFLKRVTISSDGVEYKDCFKRYYLSWVDIKEVGLGAVYRSRWIYFSIDKINSFSELKVPVSIDGYELNERFIKVGYSKYILEEVKKHWKNELEGISKY